MQTFLNKISILLVAIFAIFSASAAEKVSFELNAPMIASVGEPFRVEFSLNATPDKGSFAQPTFDNFDVLAGPSVSQSSSTQIINGKMSSSKSYNITFVLSAQTEGNFAIGAASVKVGGKSYSTKPTTIEVRKSSPNDSSESRANNSVGKDDLLLRLELSSTSAYRGEPIRATLKLYSRVAIAGSESEKKPEFNGFWTQQLDVEQGPYRETLNGKAYDAYYLAEYLLYPQQDGKITIQPAEMTIVAQVVVQSNSGFNPFFGGQEFYTVRRKLKTPTIEVQVKPFPAGAPASFAGAVGNYKMSHKLSASEVAANSAVTLQLTISGSGNLNFISAPKLSLPSSFELYDVKSEEKLQNSASGSRGYRTFDYPFIVRAEGDYEIAPVEFTYFDLSTKQYVTLATPPMNIVVTPDKGGVVAQSPVIAGAKREDVQLLGEDIRFIKLENPNLVSVVSPLVLSSAYWTVVVAMLLFAVIVYLIVRKRIRDNQNIVLVKGKRASKVAIRRFRIAAKYMREQDRRAFYEEMLRALWGYLGDKFNIPVADLTREVVREELSRRGASEEAESVIAVIARCEEAQYSPQSSAEMNDIYEEGVDAVSKIEKVVKR